MGMTAEFGQGCGAFRSKHGQTTLVTGAFGPRCRKTSTYRAKWRNLPSLIELAGGTGQECQD
jgi:hypothetical protein